MVEFIDYDGKYPCLCYGTLSIKINEQLYHLNNVMVSGGRVWFDDEWNEYVESGEWEINLNDYPELEPYKEEITQIVNENVGYGCCGGCV